MNHRAVDFDNGTDNSDSSDTVNDDANYCGSDSDVGRVTDIDKKDGDYTYNADESDNDNAQDTGNDSDNEHARRSCHDNDTGSYIGVDMDNGKNRRTPTEFLMNTIRRHTWGHTCIGLERIYIDVGTRGTGEDTDEQSTQSYQRPGRQAA